MDHSVELDIRVFPDLETLSWGAANEAARLIQTATERNGRAAIALAGGHTPRRLYQIIADAYGKEIAWERVYLFWGDERCVPPDHPESNFRMAKETLLAKIEIPPENVHRIPTELEPPERAADAYEQTLKSFFGRAERTFDLVLLGVGPDGHTASLFPGDPVLSEQVHWVRTVLAPPTYPTRPRITLMLPTLNKARSAFFLASGTEKRVITRAILSDPPAAAKRYPAAMVHGQAQLLWFLDAAADGAERSRD